MVKGTYDVRCDECKKPMKRNATFIESVQGGICPQCRKRINKQLKA